MLWLFLRHLCAAAVLGVLMHEVTALLDTCTQGCTLGILPAIKVQRWLFAAAAAPVLPCVMWRLSLTRARKVAVLGVSQGIKAQRLL